MGWDYAYQAGDEGGTFTDLADYTTAVVLKSEGFAGRRGRNKVVPYLDGEVSSPFKFLTARAVLLDTHLRYTNAVGVVDHVNGKPGHAYENLAELKKLLGWGGRNRRMLRRTDPNAGAVETRIECLPTIDAFDRRYVFTWILRQLDGLWREQTLQSDEQLNKSVLPFAYTILTGGNYPIADPKITLTCVAAGSSPSIEQTALGEKITVAGSFVPADVIVIDLGRDRAITLNGDRYAAATPTRAWWMRLQEDTAALGMTLDATSGTWDVKIEWRNKWI